MPARHERSRRLVAAAEARARGQGGMVWVAKACGVSCSTIARGLKELGRQAEGWEAARMRRPGGGRKPLRQKDPRRLTDVEARVAPATRGDPESPLRGTSKRVRTLARQLHAMGHAVSYPVVGALLREAGYSLPAHQKMREAARPPARNAQVEDIHRRVRQQQRADGPVISVDTQQKALVGDGKHTGRVWRPEGRPHRVRVHDFLLPGTGNAIPYGGYDLTRPQGGVSVGIDHDTAACAVHRVRRWGRTMGRPAYRRAQSLLMTADAGGGNGARSRRWKGALPQLADHTRLSMAVCHFPPGTSTGNPIEPRLCSCISQNWRGQPLVSLAVIVRLIAATRTSRGLRVRCALDSARDPNGDTVTDEQLATLHIQRALFHGDGNYTMHPRPR